MSDNQQETEKNKLIEAIICAVCPIKTEHLSPDSAAPILVRSLSETESSVLRETISEALKNHIILTKETAMTLAKESPRTYYADRQFTQKLINAFGLKKEFPEE